ncbi:MAG: FAD-dependent oxidoreductase [Acidobacteriota bacterium]
MAIRREEAAIDVAVIGAGVFGAWTAWWLASEGHRVRLIDAYGPANARASSSDHSRLLRAGYGADVIYSEWATSARRDWAWLSEESGESLWTSTGVLFLGEPDNQYLRATHQTLARAGIAVEWLEPEELARRFPQIHTADLGPAVLEPDAGVLRARAAVNVLVRLALSRHGVRCDQRTIAPLDEQSPRPRVVTRDGDAISAAVYVLACGPWLPRLLPQSVGGRIRPTRQEVLYFGIPPGDARFSHPALPVWIDFAAGVYGVPDLDSCGFKIGIDRHGPPIDPDAADRFVSPELIDRIRTWVGHRFPGLADAPLVESRVCQYENSSSGDFLIDRHPSWPNVWIVGGGSGHGFKHGPSVGRHVADLVTGRAGTHPRFRLASKTTAAERSVY